MSEKFNPSSELIKTATGVVLSVVGLIKAAQELYDAWVKISNNSSLLSSLDESFILFLFIIGIGLWLLIDGLSKRSRLLIPENFEIKNDTTRLVGRTQDIDALAHICMRYHEIRLVGESGVGKTALIRKGLQPVLKEEGSNHPIYIDTWGTDWVMGPQAALSSAILHTLTANQFAELDIMSENQEVNPFPILKNFHAMFGRTPIIIFDEFHDYTSLYKYKLYDSKNNSWIDNKDLIAKNPFWKQIKQLVDKKLIRVLFATLSSESRALRIVQFSSTEPYVLGRLEPIFIRQLLTEITVSSSDDLPVISDPERGWNRLKEQLVKDFTNEGPVLPVRIKAVLYGLTKLPSMTTRDYKLVGGLHGLEVSFVEKCVNNTVSFSDLNQSQVRSILIDLIDSSNSRLKTRIKSTDSIINELVKSDISIDDKISVASKVENALRNLNQLGILREYEDSESGESYWGYYHDYFCRNILEAEKRANRWLTLLRERKHAFYAIHSGYLQAWQLLLSPLEQIKIAYARLRGRVFYGPYRQFAAISLVKFIPYVLLPIGFFLVIDSGAGAKIKSINFLQKMIDRYNLSVVRPVYNENKIKEKASNLRQRLLSDIQRRRDSTGWIPGDIKHANVPDPWSHSQALCAVLTAPEIKKDNQYLLFRESFFVLPGEEINAGVNKEIKYGWLNGVNPDITVAMPNFWTAAAIGKLLKHQEFLNQLPEDKLKQLMELLNYTQSVAPTYRPTNSGGWNIFPSQVETNQHSTYATALALLMLLEIHDANLPWEGNEYKRNQLMNETVTWLSKEYDNSSELPGWHGMGYHETGSDPVKDGLTLQIYSELLRMDAKNMGYKIPNEMIENIPKHLVQVTYRDLNYENSSIDYQNIEFTTHKGVKGRQKMPVKFLWYPWAIECAARYLEFAKSHSVPPEDVVKVRRALGYLIVDIGEKALDQRIQSQYVFESAEMLYALSSTYLIPE